MEKDKHFEPADKFKRKRKNLDLYVSAYPKLKKKAAQSGYNNLKNYLEDYIHDLANEN